MNTQFLIPCSTLNNLKPEDLHEAFSRLGAFRLKHAIDPRLIKQLRTSAEQVLHLPLLAKAPYFRSETSAGYTPPGIEGVKGKGPDFHRHFWDVLSPDRALNRMPPQCVAFQTAAYTVYRAAENAAYQVFALMDQVLGPLATTKRRLLPAAAGGQHMLRISEYLMGEQETRGDILFPAHKDFGLLTAYIGGAEPGLQMEIDGDWLDVYNEAGSMILACGTTLNKIIGSPLYRPVTHRVVAKSKQRLSAVLFTEPRPEIPLADGETSGAYLLRKAKEVRHE